MAQNQHDVVPLVQINHVPATALHSIWPMLRSDLEDCIAQDRDQPLLEDVYTLVKAGTWGLYVGTLRNAYVGFIVLQLLPEWSGGTRCHLVYVSGPGFLESGHAFLTKFAKSHNCTRLTFRASKEGFGRLTKRLGYVPISRDYELRI